MTDAVNEVVSGHMFYYKSATNASVPKTTLERKVKKVKDSPEVNLKERKWDDSYCGNCYSVSGVPIPLMLSFPRQRMKPELLDGAPTGIWTVCDKSGWMQTAFSHEDMPAAEELITPISTDNPQPGSSTWGNCPEHPTNTSIRECRIAGIDKFRTKCIPKHSTT
ncbi:hypothetical protein PR048_023287 [Dryococelus australis]|uniref:Uncharacterized protein n=1 Tax=Dryococelus australis TaxID=614101 RepID=A0ABQ9GTP1_9NEOP|nr:hypothetical protein PR048_023287 [Dryococelus australis]